MQSDEQVPLVQRYQINPGGNDIVRIKIEDVSISDGCKSLPRSMHSILDNIHGQLKCMTIFGVAFAIWYIAFQYTYNAK